MNPNMGENVANTKAIEKAIEEYQQNSSEQLNRIMELEQTLQQRDTKIRNLEEQIQSETNLRKKLQREIEDNSQAMDNILKQGSSMQESTHKENEDLKSSLAKLRNENVALSQQLQIYENEKNLIDEEKSRIDQELVKLKVANKKLLTDIDKEKATISLT